MCLRGVRSIADMGCTHSLSHASFLNRTGLPLSCPKQTMGLLLPLCRAINQSGDRLRQNSQGQTTQGDVEGASRLHTVILVLVGRHVEESRPGEEEGGHGQGESRQISVEIAEEAG